MPFLILYNFRWYSMFGFFRDTQSQVCVPYLCTTRCFLYIWLRFTSTVSFAGILMLESIQCKEREAHILTNQHWHQNPPVFICNLEWRMCMPPRAIVWGIAYVQKYCEQEIHPHPANDTTAVRQLVWPVPNNVTAQHCLESVPAYMSPTLTPSAMFSNFMLNLFGVPFVVPVTRYSGMAERLFARNRMWDVHRNLVTLVYRHDISSSQRVRDPTVPTKTHSNPIFAACCLYLVFNHLFFDYIFTHL